MLITDFGINTNAIRGYLTLNVNYESLMCVYEHKNIEVDFHPSIRVASLARHLFDYDVSKYGRIYEYPFKDFFTTLVA